MVELLSVDAVSPL